jgi:3-oxoadipate enol-lactonase
MNEPEILRTAGPPSIAHDVRGTGETVVFLHGIGGNRENWADQLALFGRDFRAVSIDLRGYGDSDDVDALEFGDFVRDVQCVLDSLGVDRAHLVGLSMGGLVAQAFYAQAPQRVLSLCLVACRSGAAPVLPGARRDNFVSERLGPLRAGGPEALARSLAPTLIGSAASVQASERVMASLRKLRPDSYARVLEARMRIEPFLDLSTVNVPVLVIGSDEDKVAPLEQMRELAAAIPQARLQVIHGAGHLVNIEKPVEFNAALGAFLRGVQQPSPAAGASA